MGSSDYLEQYFAINLVFEPLVGELVRSGFFIPVGSANKDSMTPSVISAAEADYERNLANTVDLIYLLANDPTYATENRALFQRWLAKHVELGEKAADALQPLCRSRIPSRFRSRTRARSRMSASARS
jgi:propane 2-monooxygenase small subunit